MNFESRIDFIIIGAQKSGTTSLDRYLRKHKDISMANIKEVHYFDKAQNFEPKKVDYSAYHSHFPGIESSYIISGECTPSYLYLEDCAERIYNYSHSIKLICILRSPAERAFSHWLMQKKRGIEERTFEKCIRSEWDIIKAGDKVENKFAYLRRGFYSEQIKIYLKRFFKSQIMFIKYSDYVKRPRICLMDIFSFLNVDPHSYPLEEIKYFRRTEKRELSKKQKDYLNDIYKEDILKVEEQLHWNCADWFK